MLTILAAVNLSDCGADLLVALSSDFGLLPAPSFTMLGYSWTNPIAQERGVYVAFHKLSMQDLPSASLHLASLHSSLRKDE